MHPVNTPRPRRRWLNSSALAALVLLAGCGGGGGGGDAGGSGGGGVLPSACSETARKQFVLDAAREWYLFDDLLPAGVNIGTFGDAEALLDHLTATARAEGKDRYFSYLTTKTAENSLLGEGQFVGFGLRTRVEGGSRAMVIEVFEGGPAGDAGLARGDEIVAVDSGSGYEPVAPLLASGLTISEILGGEQIGLERGLRLLRNGVSRDVRLVKRTVTIDPVSDIYGVKVLPLAGTTGVGYLNLRTYISTADAQLEAAFAQFRALGLRDFIIDLRYNGGGLLSTAKLMNDLLGGARAATDVQYRMLLNARKSSQNSTEFFAVQSQSVQPVRVAFLTTGATASASEINVNSMVPWLEVAIVGENTLGKPVGQYAFDLQGCEDRLRLVTFKTVNALGQGDYYDGLAGSVPFACAAADTIEQPLGAADEGMIDAAMAWLRTGSCTTLMSSQPGRSKAGGAAVERYHRPRQPSAAQWWLPGIS